MPNELTASQASRAVAVSVMRTRRIKCGDRGRSSCATAPEKKKRSLCLCAEVDQLPAALADIVILHGLALADTLEKTTTRVPLLLRSYDEDDA